MAQQFWRRLLDIIIVHINSDKVIKAMVCQCYPHDNVCGKDQGPLLISRLKYTLSLVFYTNNGVNVVMVFVHRKHGRDLGG